MSVVLEWLPYIVFFSFLVMLFSLFVQVVLTFLVPKKMLEAYFREPYFNAFELNLFTGPYAFFRTTMMMKLAVWPNTGRKRGIPATSHELCPVWFQVVSRWHIYIMFTSGGLFFIVGGAFYFLDQMFGT